MSRTVVELTSRTKYCLTPAASLAARDFTAIERYINSLKSRPPTSQLSYLVVLWPPTEEPLLLYRFPRDRKQAVSSDIMEKRTKPTDSPTHSTEEERNTNTALDVRTPEVYSVQADGMDPSSRQRKNVWRPCVEPMRVFFLLTLFHVLVYLDRGSFVLPVTLMNSFAVQGRLQRTPSMVIRPEKTRKPVAFE